MRRRRLAPRAARRASSRSRRMVRATARLATLAQTIRSTKPAVAPRMSSVDSNWRVNSRRSGAPTSACRVRPVVAQGRLPADAAHVREVCLHLRERLIGAAPPEGRRHSAAAPFELARVHAEGTRRPRHVDVVRLRVHRYVRQHAYDRCAGDRSSRRRARERQVAAERALPVLVAEDQRRRGVVRVIGGPERPPERAA